MASRDRSLASPKVLGGVLPLAVRGFPGCAPSPLSADLPSSMMTLVIRSPRGLSGLRALGNRD